MAFDLFEEIRLNSQKLVSNSVSEYERVNGRFKIDAIKEKFLENARELFLAVVNRIENSEEISILPLRGVISKFLADLDFDTKTLIDIYREINKNLLDFLKKEPNYDAGISREFNSYLELISENIGDYSFYAALSVTNVIQNQPEYQYSEESVSFSPKEISDDRIYTLYTRNRDWKTFSQSGPAQAYSPISYNRVAVSAGFPQYRINVSYEDLIIYNNQLYKLRPDVSKPSTDRFVESEWIKYTSKVLNNKKTFSHVHLEKVRQVFGKFTEEGFAINSIISDSYIERYPSEIQIDPSVLPSTFAGVGNKLIDIIYQLEQVSEEFGGYEGSIVGGLEYISKFADYLLSSSFGRDVPEVFDIGVGTSWFGKFNLLFSAKTSENKIPGLQFLNGFGRLKSFAHGQKINQSDAKNSTRVVYNPVYSQFFSGIEDRFTGLTQESGYSERSRVDLLLFSIESIYRKCKILGDLVRAGLNSLDEKGRIPNYEGLGSVGIQLRKLQGIFPPSTTLIDIPNSVLVSPGLTGSIRYLLSAYSKLSQSTVNTTLPGKPMEFFASWVDKVSNKLKELLDVLESIGIGKSNYIPNIGFKSAEYDSVEVIKSLSALGFRDSEISQILEIKTFPELVSKFAPLSDSSDLKSFFKAYELTQLIYEFGGQDGLDAYLNFLYSTNSLDSLLNLLSLSQKDRSKLSYTQLTKYPKLIGLLISLTYAVDPAQLVKFNTILGNNNLTLLESITFLYQKGETTVIKSKSDIQVLQPMIDQIIRGSYSDPEIDTFGPSLTYDQVNLSAPIALRQWTQLIGSNLGKIDSNSLIEELYDKSVGLTPKELITILNYPDSPNSFGELVDGFFGGRLTSFLRYANLVGLGVKLGFYKNSYQVDNFQILDSGEFSVVPNIISNLRGLLDSMGIFETVLNAVLDYTFSKDTGLEDILNPLILAQNKNFETFSSLVQQQTEGLSLGQRELFASDAEILESPGIGNSRLPNRVPALNTITPEQYQLLLEGNTTIDASNTSTNLLSGKESLINGFIRFSDDNIFANNLPINLEELTSQSGSLSGGINGTQDTTLLSNLSGVNGFLSSSRDTVINTSLPSPGGVNAFNGGITTGDSNVGSIVSSDGNTSTILVKEKPYIVPKIYIDRDGGSGSGPYYDKEIVSSGLGTNYIRYRDRINGASFDPIESCRRFGGTNCEQLYESAPDRCTSSINKSLFAEPSPRIPNSSPNSIFIDRPLGSFATYIPSNTLIPISSFKSPPTYYNLLPTNAVPGRKGEPILNTITSEPIKFDTKAPGVSEYGNTEFAIVEFIRARLEQNSEFSCAGYDSPYFYQICMNVMKCKKFKPLGNGTQFLDFCPSTLSGGRLKK